MRRLPPGGKGGRAPLNTTRRFGQQDRTWTNSEFGKLIGRAMAEERQDYILALYLARYAGLRIHECFRMNAAATERALRENTLTVRGEGGKVRIVPIEDDRITMMLQRLLEKTERGHKLLVFSSPWAIDFTLRRNPGLELVETLQELDTAEEDYRRTTALP